MSVLDAERLRERAAQQTGLSGWGDLPFEAGLEALLWALEHEAGLGEQAKAAAAAATVALLTKRLRLVEDLR